MATIALFHSVLGVRDGIRDAEARLTAAGHDVHVVDQYDGQAFDDYDEASAFAEAIGYPRLMAAALDGVARLDDGFIAAGFSNGGGMAEHVAMTRPVRGVVMLSGSLPLPMLGASSWPGRVPAQIHYSIDDPFRDQEWIDSLVTAIRAGDGAVEVFDYPGAGHLFTDPSLPAEHDEANARLLWQRVLDFCDAAS